MSSGSSQLSPEPAGWCHHRGFPHFHVWLQSPSRAPSPKDKGSGLCTNDTTQAGHFRSLLNNHVCPAASHPRPATGQEAPALLKQTPQRPSHGFQCSIPKPHSILATVPLRLPGSQRASRLLQKGPLSSGARRLANEFLARHEESSGMLIVCWRISKRFGEIYTDFHVTATKWLKPFRFFMWGRREEAAPASAAFASDREHETQAGPVGAALGGPHRACVSSVPPGLAVSGREFLPWPNREPRGGGGVLGAELSTLLV